MLLLLLLLLLYTLYSLRKKPIVIIISTNNYKLKIILMSLLIRYCGFFPEFINKKSFAHERTRFYDLECPGIIRKFCRKYFFGCEVQVSHEEWLLTFHFHLLSGFSFHIRFVCFVSRQIITNKYNNK